MPLLSLEIKHVQPPAQAHGVDRHVRESIKIAEHGHDITAAAGYESKRR